MLSARAGGEIVGDRRTTRRLFSQSDAMTADDRHRPERLSPAAATTTIRRCRQSEADNHEEEASVTLEARVLFLASDRVSRRTGAAR